MTLALSLAIILAGSELFTNGVEWAGRRLQVAEAAVGSLLAAVGTALPETFIPAVALLLAARGSSPAHMAVGLGAIVGAPLMLSTVALFVMGIAALAYRRRRGRVQLKVISQDARRDLAFFFPVFLCLVIVGAIETGAIFRQLLAAALLTVYASYALGLLKLKRAEGVEVEHGLYFESIMYGDPLEPRALATAAQVVAGVAAILIGAVEFVNRIVALAAHAHLNPGVLSLVASPLATELPEKYNSVVWVRQGKDHLALGNITGAMVFQACIPAALGLAFSPWHLTSPELLAGSIALGSALILFVSLGGSELVARTLMIGAAGYAIFLLGLRHLGAF